MVVVLVVIVVISCWLLWGSFRWLLLSIHACCYGACSVGICGKFMLVVLLVVLVVMVVISLAWIGWSCWWT